jgi:K+-transporting ATPase ATPase C chain
MRLINLWRAIRFTFVFALLLGIVYPLVVTGIAQGLFPVQANGSMVTYNGRIVGSTLIAQATTSPGLFHPRPSAVDYDADNSGASNLGPTNPVLVATVRAALARLLRNNPGVTAAQVPPGMVESSASGLDPDISPRDAALQIPRVARATGLSPAELQRLIAQHESGRLLGIWGEPTVNVLQLNLAVLRATHS